MRSGCWTLVCSYSRRVSSLASVVYGLGLGSGLADFGVAFVTGLGAWFVGCLAAGFFGGLLWICRLVLVFLALWLFFLGVLGISKVSIKSCGLTGCIPAWAGEPSILWPPLSSGTVYPRVGGGTWVPTARLVVAIGLSPRGRGNLRLGPVLRLGPGSIPAWAGEPP